MGRRAKSVTIDSAEFDKAAQRLIATSKRTTKELLNEQGKIIIVEAAKITPPNKNFKWNRKGGEQAASNDLARLFVASKSKDAETNLAAVHRSNRNRLGRVPRKVDKVPAKGLAQYRRKVLALVGKQAAGWKAAAIKLGAKLPAWIARHDRAGYINYKQQGSRGVLELANAGVYARARGSIERRLKAVLAKRAGAINRRVDYFLKQNAKASGFGVR